MTEAEQAVIDAAIHYVEVRNHWVVGNKNSKLGDPPYDTLSQARAGTRLAEAVKRLMPEMEVHLG